MDVYRTPDERFVGLPEYPFEARYVEMDSLRMHYVDEGPREGDPVLLLHGEPTWSFLYRKVIAALLADDVRCVAPDYYGFGRSDKPVEREFYTFDRHYRSVAELVDLLDLLRVTVVVQDWGGPIGLRLAVDHPERVARLVILNTGIFSGRPPSDTWLQFRAFMRRLGTDIRPGQLVNLTCGNTLGEDVVAAYDAPHPTPESKTGVLMFPELVPTESDHPSAAAMMDVREGIAEWDRPALVLFSDSDPIFSPKAAERMAERIPGAGPPEFVQGAGHFLQEQKGEEIGERIARFLRE